MAECLSFLSVLQTLGRLELLSSATLSSPLTLRSRVGNARTYTWPLQRDLNMSVVTDWPGGVSYVPCNSLEPAPNSGTPFPARGEVFAV